MSRINLLVTKVHEDNGSYQPRDTENHQHSSGPVAWLIIGQDMIRSQYLGLVEGEHRKSDYKIFYVYKVKIKFSILEQKANKDVCDSRFVA